MGKRGRFAGSEAADALLSNAAARRTGCSATRASACGR